LPNSALGDGQLRRIVHADVLYAASAPPGFPPPDSNVPHVVTSKTRRWPYRLVFAISRRSMIFDGHVPAAEIDHLRAKRRCNAFSASYEARSCEELRRIPFLWLKQKLILHALYTGQEAAIRKSLLTS